MVCRETTSKLCHLQTAYAMHNHRGGGYPGVAYMEMLGQNDLGKVLLLRVTSDDL